jgi:DNA-3-methyladenine glycosylase II
MKPTQLMSNLPTPLTDQILAHALAELSARDADLARILDRHGPPPMWARQPGFPTLIHIILEQQVSLASAKAAFDRLLAVAAPLTPERFLALDDETLRAAGFSRQKAGYSRHLAQAMVMGEFDLEGLATLADDLARAALITRKGIGPWSADIYLLMALLRPDVWPVGDLGLQVAMQQIKQLSIRPTAEEMMALGEPWRPWRSVAARLLWHHYLSH